MSDEDRKSIQHKRKFPFCDNSTSNNLCYQESVFRWNCNQKWKVGYKRFFVRHYRSKHSLIKRIVSWQRVHDIKLKKVICLEMIMKRILNANILLSKSCSRITLEYYYMSSIDIFFQCQPYKSNFVYYVLHNLNVLKYFPFT